MSWLSYNGRPMACVTRGPRPIQMPGCEATVYLMTGKCQCVSWNEMSHHLIWDRSTPVEVIKTGMTLR